MTPLQAHAILDLMTQPGNASKASRGDYTQAQLALETLHPPCMAAEKNSGGSPAPAPADTSAAPDPSTEAARAQRASAAAVKANRTRRERAAPPPTPAP